MLGQNQRQHPAPVLVDKLTNGRGQAALNQFIQREMGFERHLIALLELLKQRQIGFGATENVGIARRDQGIDLAQRGIENTDIAGIATTQLPGDFKQLRTHRVAGRHISRQSEHRQTHAIKQQPGRMRRIAKENRILHG